MTASAFIVVLSLCIRYASSFTSPLPFAKLSQQSALHVSTSSADASDEYDVVIVGSGIGGLCSAAICSLYGYSTAVFESHYAAGGAAHGFTARAKGVEGTFSFDTGPSFFSGLNPDIEAKASNPLRTVLDAINERVECYKYESFGLKFPEGDFIHTTSFGKQNGVLDQVSGSAAVNQWDELMKRMEPLEAAVAAMPTAALRFDIGAVLTAGQFLPNFASTNPLENLKLTKPFSNIVSGSVTDTFTKNWIDLLCFCLSGLPASGTITAEMGLMMGEFYAPGAIMDCPKGGAKAIIDALVKGVEKKGGEIYLKSKVDEIVIEDRKATGVKVGGKQIGAKKAVISNLSVWDLFNSGILDNNAFDDGFVEDRKATPVGKSFMHLHVGFEMSREELEQLQAHYMYIDDWARGVDAEDNAVLLSIPSVHDETLAPPGHAVLHIYTPATEDFARWEGIDRKSEEYKQLKEERSQYLWTVLEKIIPDIRTRTKLVQIGTPLTHQRFLNRHRGSYGPAIVAGEGSFPFPKTPVDGLLVCGDSCFPGIGVPAVAGSGILAANSVSLDSVGKQLELLEGLKR
jgi:phytoene dehydrogenase-like protein